MIRKFIISFILLQFFGIGFSQEIVVDTIHIGNNPVLDGTIHVRKGVETALSDPGIFVNIISTSSDVFSVESGTVTNVKNVDEKYFVMVKGRRGKVFGYFNLEKSNVRIGDKIFSGSKIGRMVNSETGVYNLHFNIFFKKYYLAFDRVVDYLTNRRKK